MDIKQQNTQEQAETDEKKRLRSIINKLSNGCTYCERIIKYKGNYGQDVESDRAKGLINFDDGENRYYLKIFGKNDSAEVKKFYEVAANDWNISTIITKGDYGDRFYIIEKEIEGSKNLDTIMFNNENLYNIEQIIETVKKICLAISPIHNKDYVHTDLSPANILIDENGNVTIIDWECVHKVNSEKRGPRGTGGYCAPEIMNDQKIKYTSTDIYSIGKILQKWAQTTEYYNYVKESMSKLRKIIEKCAKDNPQERYKNVESLEKDLTRVQILRILESKQGVMNDNFNYYSKEAGGQNEIDKVNKDYKNKELNLLFLGKDRKNKNRWIGFAEDKMCCHGSKMKDNVDIVSFFDVIYVNCNKDKKCLDIITTKKITNQDEDRPTYEILNVHGADAQMLNEIIDKIINCRENNFSEDDKTKYYAKKCKEVNDRLRKCTIEVDNSSEKHDDKPEDYWDIIIMLGENGGELCKSILAEVYYNKAKRLKNLGNNSIEYLNCLTKAAKYGNIDAETQLNQINMKDKEKKSAKELIQKKSELLVNTVEDTKDTIQKKSEPLINTVKDTKDTIQKKSELLINIVKDTIQNEKEPEEKSEKESNKIRLSPFHKKKE